MAHALAAAEDNADGAAEANDADGSAETGDAAEANCAAEANDAGGAALTHLSGIGKSKAALHTSRSWLSENSSKKSEAR